MRVYGPDVRAKLIRDAWRAYQEGGDGKYVYLRFKTYVRRGRVVIGEIVSAGEVEARFGVELLVNEGGPYASMLYLAGSGLRFWIWELVEALQRITRAYTAWLSEPRLYIGGRRGWRRYARSLGIVVDENGWVNGWQEGLRYG